MTVERDTQRPTVRVGVPISSPLSRRPIKHVPRDAVEMARTKAVPAQRARDKDMPWAVFAVVATLSAFVVAGSLAFVITIAIKAAWTL